MSSWLSQMNKARYGFDLILLVFFVLASAPMATGVAVHEWVSFIYLVPFMIHLLLHWDWITSVPKRFFKALTLEHRFNVVWDMLLYAMMIVVTLSGVLISEVALPLFGLHMAEDPFWATLRHDTSNLLLPMLGIHLAMHWGWIVRMSKKVLGRNTSEAAQPAAKEAA